jgi:thiol-disulfide isomerase/thioredoxin
MFILARAGPDIPAPRRLVRRRHSSEEIDNGCRTGYCCARLRLSSDVKENTTMRLSMHAVWALAALLASSVCEGADRKPAETLAALKKGQEAAWGELDKGRKLGTTEADQKKAVERFYRSVGDLGRRAVALARNHPGTPEAVEALVWAHSAATEDDPELAGVIYDMLAERYLDSDTILPLCRLAWLDAVKGTRAEAFLRAAVERSRNVKVRSLCCYSLGRHQQVLASAVRNLDDPVRREILGKRLERFGPVMNGRLRALDPEKLEREAEAYFDRTIKEFGDLQPMGKDFAPLGKQAAGMLFQMHHLSIGRAAPEIQGEDIDGKPMKLSDFRGRVVVVSFWATWCGPCMGLVPHEKALVEKMKGRPFVLIGVNGDEDRARAKAVSAREGISWRSFWTGGPGQGIPVQWGVSGWPTIYVIDGNGVIRDDGFVYFQELYESSTPDKTIQTLVAEAEKASR